MRGLVLASVVALVAGAAASLAFGASGPAPGRWVIRDLGTAGGTASRAVDLNERGEVVGSIDTPRSRTEMSSRHAFSWSRGRMRDLGTLPLGGGSDMPNASWAIAINDRGQIIGESEREATGPTPHAFVWLEGAMRMVGCGRVAPIRCEIGSHAAALNERGQFVGSIATRRDGYRFGFGVSVAYIWRNGTLTRLGPLPGLTYSRARDVNERGDVIGASYAVSEESGEVRTRASLWQNGRKTDLGVLSGRNASDALAINEHGQIIGNSFYYTGPAEAPKTPTHGFLWQNGRMRDLGILRDSTSVAVAINDRGQIIGNSGSAFLWQKGKMTDLGVLPGDQGSEAVAINNRGEIVGISYGAGGRQTAFVWRNGTMTSLPNLPGRSSSAPTAINARGQIVGWSGNVRSFGGVGAQRAVLWTRGRTG